MARNYGCDFKLWMQVAVFVLQDIPDEQLIVWELLSEVPRKRIDCRRHKSFCVQHGLNTARKIKEIYIYNVV